MLYSLAILGLYLGGIDGSGLYAWLGLVPADVATKNGAFAVLGAAMLVYAVKAGAFSNLLQSRLVQFLGRISYSLYLVHLPIILSVACGSYLWLVVHQGFGRVLGAAVAFCIAFPTAIGVALVFTRLVDEPCIKLAKRLFPAGATNSTIAPVKPAKNLAPSA